MTTARQTRSANDRSNGATSGTGRTVAIGAAAAVVGAVLGNLLRKSAVQAPTVLAGE